MNSGASGGATVTVTGGPSSGSKKHAFQGPAFLKMLVSNLVAGSIIGKNGSVISSIENDTGTSMKLSPSNSFFPNTNDRIVVMSGEQEQVNRALAIILDKIGEVAAVQYASEDSEPPQVSRCEINCKIVVPKSAVSGIIGKGGSQIKQLQEDCGAKIQISSREQGLNERIVSITGSLDNVHGAAVQIATVIQEDSNLKDHVYVTYNSQHGSGGGFYGAVPVGFGGYGQFAGSGGGGGSYPYRAQFSAASSTSGSPPIGQFSACGLEQLLDPCDIIMEIPDPFMGPLVGKAGIYLTEIMRSTGANIKLSPKGEFVPGTQNRKVTLSGPVTAVHHAHTRLLLRLKECATNPLGSRSGGSLGGGGYGSSPGGQMTVSHNVHPSQSNPGMQHASGYAQYGTHAQYTQLPAGYHQQYGAY